MQAQLSGVQHRSEGAVQLKGQNGAQKMDAVKLSRVQGSSVRYYGAAYSLAVCNVAQGYRVTKKGAS